MTGVTIAAGCVVAPWAKGALLGGREDSAIGRDKLEAYKLDA